MITSDQLIAPLNFCQTLDGNGSLPYRITGGTESLENNSDISFLKPDGPSMFRSTRELSWQPFSVG